MEVEFRSSFFKDLYSINQHKLNSEIDRFIFLIYNTDKLSDIPNLKKLNSKKNAYRYRIGDYRVGFYFEGSKIILTRVGMRKDFYNRFPLLFI